MLLCPALGFSTCDIEQSTLANNFRSLDWGIDVTAVSKYIKVPNVFIN